MLKFTHDTSLEYYGLLYILQSQKYVIMSEIHGHEDDNTSHFHIFMDEETGKLVQEHSRFFTNFSTSLADIFPGSKIWDIRMDHTRRYWDEKGKTQVWELSFYEQTPERILNPDELDLALERLESMRQGEEIVSPLPQQLSDAIELAIQD